MRNEQMDEWMLPSAIPRVLDAQEVSTERDLARGVTRSRKCVSSTADDGREETKEQKLRRRMEGWMNESDDGETLQPNLGTCPRIFATSKGPLVRLVQTYLQKHQGTHKP